jgi:predicted metal-binding membrane protein
MTAPAPARPGVTSGPGPAFTAARHRLGLVLLLFGLAALAWGWTAERMKGMDDGPWTALGTLGGFLGIWVTMMSAMMLPSVAPTIALYSRLTRRRSPLSPLMFGAGYFVTWAGAGMAAFAIAVGAGQFGDALAWDNGGRWLAGVTLLVAAAWELTSLKDVCLGKCHSPLGFLLGCWREGPWGALRMGMRNGAWCVGCCWALMASLFALGVMSLTWMAVVAGIIAGEKLLPWSRVSRVGTAVLLCALGALVLLAPDAVPGLTIPTGMPMNMDMDM